MNHTLRQRSKLVQAAEREPEPEANRGDYIIFGVCVVGLVVILILNALGVQ